MKGKILGVLLFATDGFLSKAVDFWQRRVRPGRTNRSPVGSGKRDIRQAVIAEAAKLGVLLEPAQVTVFSQTTTHESLPQKITGKTGMSAPPTVWQSQYITTSRLPG